MSGLRGQLVVASPLGPNATLSADGALVLGRASAGTGYAVSVVNQPTGQLCTASSASGTLVAQDVSVRIVCTNQLTALSAEVRAGQFVSLDGAPSALAPASVEATLAGFGALTLQRTTGSLGFVVPTVSPGPQLLTVMLGGQSYEFRFQVQTRSASAPPSASVIADANLRVAASISTLEASTTPGRAEVGQALRQQLNEAVARASTLSESDRVLVANFLEGWQAEMGAAASVTGPRALAFTSVDRCTRGMLRFLSNSRLVRALVPVLLIQPPNGVTVAAGIAMLWYMSEIFTFIDDYLYVECFPVDQTLVELDQSFEPSGTGRGAAAYAPKRMAAASGESRSLAAAAASVGPLMAMHDVPLRLRATVKGTLPSELAPSAADIQSLLADLSFLLPTSVTRRLAEWTETFTRTVDLSQYTLGGVTSSRIRFSGRPGGPGVLIAQLSYLPGALPVQPERFDLVLLDRYGRERRVPVVLALPALPVVANGSLATAVNVGVSGTIAATGAKAFRVVSAPRLGRVTLAPDGSGALTYMPNPGQAGVDSFSVVGTNDWGESDPAVITVDISLLRTAVTLSASPNPSEGGGTTTFTAQVAVLGTSVEMPEGTVVVTGGGSWQFPGCTINVGPSGTGSCTVTFPVIATGTGSYTARYLGAAYFGASESAPLNMTVGLSAPGCVISDYTDNKRMDCYYAGRINLKSTELFKFTAYGATGQYTVFRDDASNSSAGTVIYNLYGATYAHGYTFKQFFPVGARYDRPSIGGSFDSSGRARQLSNYTYHANGGRASAKGVSCDRLDTTSPFIRYGEDYYDIDGNPLPSSFFRQSNDVSLCPSIADIMAINPLDYRDGPLYKLMIPR